MTTRSENEDWMSIAEQASKEMNPAKLMTLVEQLCGALDKRNKRRLALEQPEPAVRKPPIMPNPFRGSPVDNVLQGPALRLGIIGHGMPEPGQGQHVR
jgi:hypothetical protein